MRILVYSPVFSPGVGGVEEMGRMLASEWVLAGHEVEVITPQPASAHADGSSPFKVLRETSQFNLWTVRRDHDLLVHNQFSLKFIPVGLLNAKPMVAIHHTWITRPDGTVSWLDRLKRLLLRTVASISVSRAIADSLPVRSKVIHNCYDTARFPLPFQRGTFVAGSLVVVGRLVSDKGVDLAVRALDLLRRAGRDCRLTIIGSGPEEGALRNLVGELGLTEWVTFAGLIYGERLPKELSRHEVMIVPSRWREPFGIVALEGLACGCKVVVADGGGLVEAVAGFGFVFRRGDVEDLARAAEAALDAKADREAVERRLAELSPASVARRYLDEFAVRTKMFDGVVV